MLVVLTSHPIQYQAPLWRALAAETGGGLPFEVWFLTDQGVRKTDDKDFGQAFAWDVDLLSGYQHKFLELSGKWDMGKFDGIPLAAPIRESLREAGATALWVEGWRFKPFWDAVSAAKRLGIPVFLRGETSDKIAEKGGLFSLVRNFALHRLFAKVDYFLAIGQASRRFYLRHGVPARKLVDAPYCVDNEFFRTEAGKVRGAGGGHGAHFERGKFDIVTDQQRAIREEWKIPLAAKVVMFCGKFVRKKRPLDMVLAARAHFDRGHFDNLKDEQQSSRPWHLLFVGSGELGDELRAACDVRFDAEEGAGERVAKGTGGRRQESGQVGGASESASGSMLHAPRSLPPATFAGFLNQSQISRAYAVSDVVVLPSEAWETLGLVVNEATAAGIPTVVSDACGCADDFGAQNPYTRVFPVGDTVALAAAIEAGLALGAKAEVVTTHADGFAPRITAEAVVGRLKAGSSG